MKIFHATLSKSVVAGMPDEERNLFIALAHLQNELNFLLRSVLWSSDFSSENDTVVSAQLSLSYFYTKLLAGKLKEGWLMVENNFNNRKCLYDLFVETGSQKGKDALSELKKYFGKKNLIHLVRTDYAFHYSPDKMNSMLSNLPDELEVFIEQGTNANTLYNFAEVIANRAMLADIDGDDLFKANDKLKNETTIVTKNFSRFCGEFVAVIAKKYTPEIWETKGTEAQFEDLPDYSKSKIEWFTDTQNGLR